MRTYILRVSGLVLALLMGACANTAVTHLVTVAYQNIGDFQAWGPFDGADGTLEKGSKISGTYHVYMLRGIANTDTHPQAFTFHADQVSTVNHSHIDTNIWPAVNMPEHFLAPPYLTMDVPPGMTQTIPIGNGVMFIVFEPGDTPGGGPRFLTYQSKIGESVVMRMLDPKAQSRVDVLGLPFLNDLHTCQNYYENNYGPDGEMLPAPDQKPPICAPPVN